MTALECNKCGGALDIIQEKNIGICQYCGAQMIISAASTQQTNLYNRANWLRQSNEFDLALQMYENLLAEEFPAGDVYWGALLCKYGIEYVEDGQTKKRVATCHRAVYKSILQHPYYIKALELSPPEVRSILEADAQEIDTIQKDILKAAQQEKAYDIFICYKETDEATGQRTPDSVLAQDIYNAFHSSGYYVFFARKSLSGLLGTQYEAKIFAALASAKIMLVVTTNPEHSEAVWVKNEWSRFLELISEGQKKTIIPIYKDMSPYQLPAELSSFQALDATMIGFMQELEDAVQRLIRSGKGDVPADGGAVNLQSLLLRGSQSLARANWEDAKSYYQRAVDASPEHAEGWWGLLCAGTGNLAPRQTEQLLTDEQVDYYHYAMQYAQGDQKQQYADEYEDYRKQVYALNHKLFHDEFMALSDRESEGKLTEQDLEGIAQNTDDAAHDQLYDKFQLLSEKIVKYADDGEREGDRKFLEDYLSYRKQYYQLIDKYVNLNSEDDIVMQMADVREMAMLADERIQGARFLSYIPKVLVIICGFLVFRNALETESLVMAFEGHLIRAAALAIATGLWSGTAAVCKGDNFLPGFGYGVGGVFIGCAALTALPIAVAIIGASTSIAAAIVLVIHTLRLLQNIGAKATLKRCIREFDALPETAAQAAAREYEQLEAEHAACEEFFWDYEQVIEDIRTMGVYD